MPETWDYDKLGHTTWIATVALGDPTEPWLRTIGTREIRGARSKGLAVAYLNQLLTRLHNDHNSELGGVEGSFFWGRVERGTYQDNSFDDNGHGWIRDASWEADHGQLRRTDQRRCLATRRRHHLVERVVTAATSPGVVESAWGAVPVLPSGPFPQAARRTRRASLPAPGSPRFLSSGGDGRNPGVGDLAAAVAVPGDRHFGHVEQRDPVDCWRLPSPVRGDEPATDVGPRPAVPHAHHGDNPPPDEVLDGGEDTLFLRATLWRQPAENAAKSLTKGARVIVTGRLRQRSYDSPTGEQRTVVELDVEELGASLRHATAAITKATGEAPLSTSQTVSRAI